MSLHQRGQLGPAEQLYRVILDEAPDCVDVIHFLGLAATQRGAWAEGIELLRAALALHPAASIQVALARALIDAGDAAAALLSCEAVIAAEPLHVEAWLLRGNALQLTGAHPQALVSYDRALRQAPDFAPALNNRAHSLRMLGRPQEALDALERALASRPDYALALNNQGLALLDLGRTAAALASFERALELQPRFPEAMGNRGTALIKLKRFAHAAQQFEQLDAVAPGFDAALGNAVFARRCRCDWEGLEGLTERLIAAVRRGELADLPLSFLYTADSPTMQLQCARVFTQARYPARPVTDLGPPPGPYSHERIRVAYVSGDFGEHAVSQLLAGVVEHHDAQRFDTLGIAWGRQQDGPLRHRLERAFGRFIDVTRRSDLEIAALMRDLEVDIAVDLMGHTQGQRTGIFAYRAAPVQVSYLGYPGTSGAPYLDYVIGDDVVIPAGEEAAYSEQVLRLPRCYLPPGDRHPPSAEPQERAEPRKRAEAGLPAQGFVFCAFNNPTKITHAVFSMWLMLLQEAPGSVLWLRADGEARAALEREAYRVGLDAGRLVFAPPEPSIDAHRARLRLADLFLDTLPYNGHSTACDALGAGVPVLTCRGHSFAGRVGASLLESLGLPELIADTLEDYAARALELARNADRHVALCAKLAGLLETSPVFDPRRYTRQLEAALASLVGR